MRRGVRTSSAEFRAAHSTANAALNPPPENLHLVALKFVSTTVREFAAAGTTFANEPSQYVAVYAAQRAALGRPLTTLEAERLRRASLALWMALSSSRPLLQQMLGEMATRSAGASSE